ncbi:MAG: 3-oxoacyl-[acyl-carrier-protein] synthase-3 [Cognaticolwellia sp.]|jgi:2-heptyl-4(1H)-quinolone synthase
MNDYISGTGYYLPENKVSNNDLVKRINTSDQFIRERTGIVNRYHVNNDQAVSDLMIPAAISAIEDANLTPKDIDFLLVNTLSPDHHDPSQACFIQRKIGLDLVPAMDIRAQCSGFMYGFEMASALLATGRYENILVVCGEVLSKRMDCSDRGRNLAVLLGDGAAAAVISKGNEKSTGLLDIELGADGDYFDLLMTASPGSAGSSFISEQDITSGATDFFMNGKPMFDHATETLSRIATNMLAKHKLTLADVDHVLCHQPNLRILEAVQDKLSIPNDKFIITVNELGNMASASFPVTFARSISQFKPNQLILMITYGSGATWGSALYRMPEKLS